MKFIFLILSLSSLAMSGCFLEPGDGDETSKSTQELTLLWDYAYDYDSDAPFVSPTIIDDQYVISSGDTKITSLRITDGSLVWKTPFEYHAPLTNQNFGLVDNIIIGTIHQTFIAWDKSNGQVEWISSVEDTLSWSWSRGITKLSDSFVMGSQGNHLYQLFPDGTYNVYKLDARSYESSVYNNLLIVQQRIDYYGLISAYDKNTWELNWRFEPGEYGIASRAVPILSENIVYVGTNGGPSGARNAFFALNAETGAEIWRHEDILTFHAILEGDYIYINDGAGIIKLRKSDGGLEWYTDFDAGAGTAPIAYGYGYIYAPHSGYMFIVDADTGKIVHGLNPPHGSLLLAGHHRCRPHLRPEQPPFVCFRPVGTYRGFVVKI